METTLTFLALPLSTSPPHRHTGPQAAYKQACAYGAVRDKAQFCPALVDAFNRSIPPVMGHDDAVAAAGLALTIHHTHAQGMEPLQQQDGEGVGGPMYLLPPDAEGNDAEDDKLVSPPFDFPHTHTHRPLTTDTANPCTHTHTRTSSYQSSLCRRAAIFISVNPTCSNFQQEHSTSRHAYASV